MLFGTFDNWQDQSCRHFNESSVCSYVIYLVMLFIDLSYVMFFLIFFSFQTSHTHLRLLSFHSTSKK